jgi:hypothetical protein
MKRPVTLAIVIGLGITSLLACAALMLVLANTGDARLLSIDGIQFLSTDCLTADGKVRPGAQIKFLTTWLAQKDLVGVIDEYASRGYRPINNYTSSLEMLPAEPQRVELWVAQARVLRALSLAYTPEFWTRIESITTLTLCPP